MDLLCLIDECWVRHAGVGEKLVQIALPGRSGIALLNRKPLTQYDHVEKRLTLENRIYLYLHTTSQNDFSSQNATLPPIVVHAVQTYLLSSPFVSLKDCSPSSCWTLDTSESHELLSVPSPVASVRLAISWTVAC